MRAECHYGGVEVPDGWMPGTHPYKVTLRLGRRALTVPFFQGPAHTKEPTAADVLHCLCSDASVPADFADFCAEFGYDADSRKAEQTHKACMALKPRVLKFLGPLFDDFARAEH